MFINIVVSYRKWLLCVIIGNLEDSCASLVNQVNEPNQDEQSKNQDKQSDNQDKHSENQDGLLREQCSEISTAGRIMFYC